MRFPNLDLVGLVLVTVLLISSNASAFASDRHYVVFTLGGLHVQGPPGTDTWGINDAGVVVGSSFIRASYRPYRWEGGTMTELPILGGEWGRAYAINNGGLIVGSSTLEGTSIMPQVAVAWRDGVIEALPTLGGEDSFAWDVNDSGMIVGESQYDPLSNFEQAVAWIDGTVIDLGKGPGSDVSSNAYGVNEDGWVVGQAMDDDLEGERAKLWVDGLEIDLGDLGGDQAWAYAVNDLDQIVGVSDLERYDRATMFGWENGRMYNLGRLTGFEAPLPSEINNAGEVVAWAAKRDTFNFFAMYWAIDTGLVILDDLLPPRTGVRLEFSRDINDHGQIVCWGRNSERFGTDGFLLSPVTPTMSLAPADGGGLVAGAENELRLVDAPPNAVVHLAWARNGGGFEIPGCALLDNALQLREPRTFATVTADANGTATYVGFIPASAAGRTVLLQAWTETGCAISELQLETVQ